MISKDESVAFYKTDDWSDIQKLFDSKPDGRVWRTKSFGRGGRLILDHGLFHLDIHSNLAYLIFRSDKVMTHESYILVIEEQIELIILLNDECICLFFALGLTWT